MTDYGLIKKKFTTIIRDSSHLELCDAEIEELFDDYLDYACFRFQECEKDLNRRDDSTQQFDEDLTNTEQWIIAHGMVLCWIKPYISYEQNMIVKVQDRDYKPNSSANHIDKLKSLYEYSADELDGFMNEYMYIGYDFALLGD